LFQVLTRSISLDELVEKVCRRIGIQGRAIRWEHAEPCMDVDKPHQLELVRADLANQQRKAAARARAAARRAGEAKPAKTTRKKPAAKKKVQPLKTRSKAASGSRLKS
jgi:hypothetical protein